ncbi:MAG TPA: hypothetical protein VK436_00490 [Methanocella sp.]|nr:hypothetical protein [Methanocella sp.]
MRRVAIASEPRERRRSLRCARTQITKLKTDRQDPFIASVFWHIAAIV